MKMYCLSALAATMVLVSGTVSADSQKDQSGESHVIPVLVHVNKAGHITDMQPAYDLRPAMKHAVEQSVMGMVGKPAMKNGVATNSQFVLMLALKPVAGSSNQYTFTYVSTRPIPVGNWHWARDLSGTGKALQLVKDGSTYSSTDVTLPCGPDHTPGCVDPSGEPRGYLAW